MTQNFDTSPNDKKTFSPLKFFKARPPFLLIWWVWVHNFIKSKFSLSCAAALLLDLCLSFKPLSRQAAPIHTHQQKQRKNWNLPFETKPPNTHTHTLPLSLSPSVKLSQLSRSEGLSEATQPLARSAVPTTLVFCSSKNP